VRPAPVTPTLDRVALRRACLRLAVIVALLLFVAGVPARKRAPLPARTPPHSGTSAPAGAQANSTGVPPAAATGDYRLR
jgi:hypothetical protein